MPRTILAVALAATLLTTPALAETRTVDLPAFTAVDISSGIDAKVTVGPQSVTAEARNAADLDELKLTVENGVLKAYTDWSLFDIFALGIDREIRVTITAPALTGVSASAGADVDAEGISGDSLQFSSSAGADLTLTGVTGKAVSLDASAGADIKADGTCETGTIEASAGADVAAAELRCADLTVDGSAGADIHAFASSSIKADASAGASITIAGKPATVTQNASAGGEIEIAE